MKNLGKVKPGSTIERLFDSFDSNGGSVTLTGLAVTGIEVYKNGSTTQRSSDSGYALLDTDGIDFDALTGIHGYSIDLADNTDAGFWAAGARYYVVVNGLTIDSQTVRFVDACFQIGMDGAVLDTTIATLASQTSFTLTAGPAEDDALNGCVVYIHDVASAVQGGFAVISDYVGSTKTVTLAAGTTFTAAAGDNISIYPPSNAHWYRETAQTARDLGAQLDATISSRASASALATAQADLDTITGADGVTLATSQGNYAPAVAGDQMDLVDAPNATAIAAIQSGLSTLTAAAAADAVWDEARSGHATQGTYGESFTTIVSGTVDNSAHTPTTTEFEADDITEATADHFIGRTIIFVSGALQYQATDITDYAKVGSNGHFTVTALTEAPANDAKFIII